MNMNRRDVERRLTDPTFAGSLEPPVVPEPEPVITKTAIELAREIVAKSRSRVKWLTVVTCLAWILATAAGIGLATLYFNNVRSNMPFHEYHYVKVHDIMQEKRGEDRNVAYSPRDLLSEEEYNSYRTASAVIESSNEAMMILSQATFLLFGLAALLSVCLITASRRCTMKQINANLASLALDLSALVAEQSTPELSGVS